MSENFAGLPYREQLAWLDDHLSTETPERLLELCASLREAAPLAYLTQRLAGSGFYARNREGFADFLIRLPETSVHAVLKTLTHDEAGPTLLEALRRVPFEALGTFCLIDRALKHSFGRLRDEYLKTLVDQAAASLQAGQPLTDEELLRIPARAIKNLPPSQALQEHRERLARRAIELLARAPKAVSQTNAEELLSRRVYTDPGHFLIELLQNADDAEARTFRVVFDDHRIVVWHDGVPFDARDLVGVTSIGQTTKRKQQIGFFGVGFKSVYEVADRPQIYSDVYRFEIADVSIPRYLPARPADLPDHGTALVLPLRTPGSRHLYDRAVALDPCLLLTLKELQALEFEHRGERHALRLEGGRSIRQEPAGWSRTYRLAEGHYRYEGAREKGRPDETRVMVGLLEQDGRPVPLPPGAPTVYSYLPTAENTGLRFFIQGHFDVPVDRERIAAESGWNRWILDRVPDLLARVAESVASLDEARGLLDVLPLPEEITSGLFRTAAATDLCQKAILPCTDGRLRAPAQTRVASPQLTELVGPQAPLLEPSPERSRRLALALGARPFGFAELLDHLEGGSVPEDTARLLDLVLEDLEQLEREDRLELVWASEERLRSLPLLPQGSPSCVFRARGRLREVYRDVKPLISPDLEDKPRCVALLERLGCRELTEHDLVNDAQALLETHRETVLALLAEAPWTVVEQAGTLELFGDVPLRATYRAEEPLRSLYEGRRALVPATLSPAEEALVARLDLPQLDLALLADELHLFGQEVHGVLAQLAGQITEPIARKLRAAAIWPDAEGRLHPLDALAVPDDPRLPGLLPEQNFLHRDVAAMAHVQRLEPPRLDVNRVLETSSRPELLELVRDHADKLTSLSVSRLFQLPIFADQHGRHRPLSELCLPPDDELKALLPERPFLVAGSLELEVAEKVGLDAHLKKPGPQLVLDELHRIDPPERALEYLAGRASELSRAQVSRCLGQPVYPDEEGRRGPLGVPLHVPEPDRVYPSAEPFRPLFRAAGMRLLDATLQRAIEPLLETAGWPRADLDTAVQLLWRLTPVSSGGRRHPLQQELPMVGRLLVDHRHQLLERYASLAELAIWETVDGSVIPAKKVVDGEVLLELVAGRPQARLLDARRLPQMETFRQLEPLVHAVPAADFLEELVGPAFLDTPQRVSRAAALLERPLTLDALGRLRREKLPAADRETLELVEGLPLEAELAHPEAPADGNVKPLRVLEAVLGDPSRRARLFDWLVHHEARVFSDAACRELLGSAPIFPTRGGRDVPAHQLVTDPDLPDLGLDWSPSEAVPERCLRLLERHLNVGRPRLEELVEQHLLPAFPDRPDEILDYLARRLEHASETVVRGLLKALDVSDRLIPPEELEEAVAILWDFTPVKPAHRSLLLKLGAPRLPDGARLRERLRRPFTRAQGLALARLLQRLPELPDTIQTAPWLPDGLGRPRPPVELFLRGPEVESLVGAFPDLYPEPERLDGRLELREAGDARLPELLRHLDECTGQGEPLSARFYRHLETGLVDRRLDPGELSRHLSERAWVLSDDGLYFNHRKVLATPAFRLFGDRRGSWEGATARYPSLCRLFGIPDRVRPEDVESFLREVAGGSPAELGRRLGNCYAFLAEASHPVPRSLAVILARRGSEVRLLPAETPGLVRSDTPSLEALFEQVGRLWVADPGPPGSEQEVDRFYRLMGIPRLREAYSVSVAAGGRDRTDGMQLELQRLRRLLRALLEVMPRVRLQRTQLAAEGWVFGERLAGLAGAGAIRAIEGLKVLYSLPGVGSTAHEAAAAFDSAGQRLLLEAAVLAEPRGHTTGLAAGLTACVYDGPGEEQVTDILEILIPLGTREAMDAYLDRRHFPVSHERSSRNPLAERLGELLDYGLHRRLERAFPELDGAEFERWRNAQEADARALYRLLGVEPSREAVKTLEQLLAEQDLEKLPAALREPQPEPIAPPPAPAELRPAARRVEAVEPNPGLWNRLTDWLGNALKETLPRWAVSDNGLTPMEQVESQLWATPKAVQQLREAPSRAGLTFAPSPLQEPHVYGLFSPAGQFDPRRQRWLPGLLARLPLAGTTFTDRVVEFNGTLLPGESRLPMPLYSRLEGRPRVSGRAGTSATLKGPDAQGGWTVKVEGQTPVNVSYQVRLGNPPRPTAGRPSADPGLVEPTVPLAGLPPEVREWVARTAADPRPDWEKALAAQEFVRRRYRYDEEYLLRPDARRAQAGLVSGQGNHHLEILHAGRQESSLGAGICYELNVMVLELLRHLGIPSLLATCWVFDLGRVDRPDHLIALALVTGAEGDCLLPLDAAADSLGPRHPLGQVDEELQLLQRAALALGLPPSSDKADLRRAALAAVGSEPLLELYLRCLRGDLEQVLELPPGVEELYRQGLVKVLKVDAYSVTPL